MTADLRDNPDLASNAFQIDKYYKLEAITARDPLAFLYNTILYAVVPPHAEGFQPVVFEFAHAGRYWRCFGMGRHDQSNVEAIRHLGVLPKRRRTYEYQSPNELTDEILAPIVAEIRAGQLEAAGKLFQELCLQIKDLTHFEAFMLAMKLRRNAQKDSDVQDSPRLHD